ncbi:MAG: hypothetical protein ACSW8F_03230, partial [bacterium]
MKNYLKRCLPALLALVLLSGMGMPAARADTLSEAEVRELVFEAIRGWKTELDLRGMGVTKSAA